MRKKLTVIFINIFIILALTFIKIRGIVFSGFLPECLFKRFTGLDCLTCGGTRATDMLIKGRFMEAVRYNIFVVLIYIILIIMWVIFTYNTFVNENKKIKFFRNVNFQKCMWIGMLAFGIGFFIIRNIINIICLV